MLILEAKFIPKEGYGFGDNITSQVIVIDTNTDTIHHFVNEDYVNNYVINDNPLAVDDDFVLLERGSTGHEEEIDIDLIESSITYTDKWEMLPMGAILEKLADLLEAGSDPRKFIVTTNSVDMGIILSNSGITSVNGNFLAKESVVNILNRVIDFSTLSIVGSIDEADLAYGDGIATETRLIYIRYLMDSVLPAYEEDDKSPTEEEEVPSEEVDPEEETSDQEEVSNDEESE